MIYRDFHKLDANLKLDEVREQLGEKGVRVAAVYQEEEFLRLISAEDLQEAFSVLTFNQRHLQQHRCLPGSDRAAHCHGEFI
jgi:hypothetical protein